MTSGNILLVEDDIKIRSLLNRILSLEKYQVFEAGNVKTGYRVLLKEYIDVVISDVILPDGNGIDFLRDIKTKHPTIEMIILTANANIKDGVEAMRLGAFDYLVKGDDNDRLVPLVGHAIEKSRLQVRLKKLEKQVSQHFGFENIIGKSEKIQESILMARRVAGSDATVLLLGETGTGKELFAKAIHSESRRNGGPFVAINCSAFSRNLLESEIFGHKAGAFTGAVKDKKGLVEEADEGTLFLDEIGEMDLELQAKLLRVLETNEFIKVGDTKTTKVDVRIIAATNRNLADDVSSNKFRNDLYYRLNVFAIHIPSLGERVKDIPILAEYFLKILSLKGNYAVKSLNPEFLRMLEQHNWKGNIRELKNLIERSIILSKSHELTVEDLPLEFKSPKEEKHSLESFNLSNMERSHIQLVMKHTRGNKVEAAKLLGIGLTTLYRKIQDYNLFPEFNYTIQEM